MRPKIEFVPLFKISFFFDILLVSSSMKITKMTLIVHVSCNVLTLTNRIFLTLLLTSVVIKLVILTHSCIYTRMRVIILCNFKFIMCFTAAGTQSPHATTTRNFTFADAKNRWYKSKNASAFRTSTSRSHWRPPSTYPMPTKKNRCRRWMELPTVVMNWDLCLRETMASA